MIPPRSFLIVTYGIEQKFTYLFVPWEVVSIQDVNTCFCSSSLFDALEAWKAQNISPCRWALQR